jgi:hypothetical protein
VIRYFSDIFLLLKFNFENAVAWLLSDRCIPGDRLQKSGSRQCFYHVYAPFSRLQRFGIGGRGGRSFQTPQNQNFGSDCGVEALGMARLGKRSGTAFSHLGRGEVGGGVQDFDCPVGMVDEATLERGVLQCRSEDFGKLLSAQRWQNVGGHVKIVGEQHSPLRLVLHFEFFILSSGECNNFLFIPTVLCPALWDHQDHYDWQTPLNFLRACLYSSQT